MMKRRNIAFALATVLVLTMAPVSYAEEAAGPVADPATLRETTNGPVEGYVEENGTYAWLGVPYGKAERFAAPEAPDAWEETLECTSFGDIAIQAARDWTTGETSLKGSTDCLNLDIYAPAEGENLPVFVFLHGGNNQTGNTTELYGQDIALTNNCIFITLNFRLNLLGFNPLPALKRGISPELDSGNFTLLDIAYALDWVRDNAAAFGGNPENITISGFSAGGRDVMAFLISPLFAGKFQKAIAFSGGMTVADPEKSAIQIAHYMAPLVVEDGLAEDEDAAAEWLLTDSEEVLDYLMNIDEGRLASLIGDAGIHMALFPHLFADGVTLPAEGFATENYNDVPVIMLTGKDEFFFFRYAGFLVSPEYGELDDETKAAADTFAMKYGSDMYRIFNGQESANTMFANYEAPIYVVQVDADEGGMGIAGHGVFKTMMDSRNATMIDPTTEGFQKMSALYNGYLTNFLHNEDGNPNGEGLEEEWTPWDPETELSMVFDAEGTEGSARMMDVSKTYDEIIEEMKADDTVSEEIKTSLINTVLNGRWFSAAQDEAFGVPSLWIADQE